MVDDDPDMAEVMVLTLGSAGYLARTAANGLEALRASAARMPALILLDMRMPVMNGWEFAREFRRRHGPAVPIIVVTAAEHSEIRAREIAAQDVLRKPFEVDDLLEKVRRFVG